ncbi:MAG: hypothetical protein KKA73_07900 [Chloroflexi bacterium]|nr:hypothetical protein [Chloroflexota bacterium]MBU1747596.1 hypothetical protein [Chloroflexota bacterium]
MFPDPMRLRFYPQDTDFEKNLAALRAAVIRQHPFAPVYLDVCICEGGRVRVAKASTAHIRPDSWFAYTDESGAYGHRHPPVEIRWVEAWWEAP